jgi:hypothetical protein
MNPALEPRQNQFCAQSYAVRRALVEGSGLLPVFGGPLRRTDSPPPESTRRADAADEATGATVSPDTEAPDSSIGSVFTGSRTNNGTQAVGVRPPPRYDVGTPGRRSTHKAPQINGIA